MNVALIHDKLHIRSFWETKINVERDNVEKEETRAKNSALGRLRDEWTVRLENRNKHLKMLNMMCIRKVEIAKSADQEDESADQKDESPDQEDESPDQEDESPDQEDESADQEDESPDLMQL